MRIKSQASMFSVSNRRHYEIPFSSRWERQWFQLWAALYGHHFLFAFARETKEGEQRLKMAEGSGSRPRPDFERAEHLLPFPSAMVTLLCKLSDLALWATTVRATQQQVCHPENTKEQFKFLLKSLEILCKEGITFPALVTLGSLLSPSLAVVSGVQPLLATRPHSTPLFPNSL